MKSLLLFAFFFLAINVTAVQAQKKKAPAKKSSSKGKSKSKKGTKSTKSTKIQTDGGSELDLFTCYEGGGPCTFTLLKGDTLVYKVNGAGASYDLFVIVNKLNSESIADFNWYTSAPDSKSGRVVINAAGIKSSRNYVTMLTPGESQLTAASAIWFTRTNFAEAGKKETKLSFDGGTQEVFYSPDADAVSTTITYRGKSVDLDGFALQNKNEGEAGRKEIWVLNESLNAMIIKADLGTMSMIIKELRSSKK